MAASTWMETFWPISAGAQASAHAAPLAAIRAQCKDEASFLRRKANLDELASLGISGVIGREQMASLAADETAPLFVRRRAIEPVVTVRVSLDDVESVHTMGPGRYETVTRLGVRDVPQEHAGVGGLDR